MGGCASHTASHYNKDEYNPDDLFLTIQWYGIQTKPYPKVAFASANRMGELKDWIKEDEIIGLSKPSPFTVGTVLSKEECSKLCVLLSEVRFQALRTAWKTENTAEFQQYVIVLHSAENIYYPLGHGIAMRAHLREVQGALKPSSADLINVILRDIRVEED